MFQRERMSSYLKILLIIVSAVSYSYSLFFVDYVSFHILSIMKISAEKRALKYL